MFRKLSVVLLVSVVLCSVGWFAGVDDAALTGLVSSEAEGPMEGVLVSAKRAASTIMTTVVTNAEGRYSFPKGRLQEGKYSINIRAVGYELEKPAGIEVTFGKTASLNLKLRKTEDLANQLTNAEWLLSVPGTDKQKDALSGCVGCHSLSRVLQSKHDAKAWMPTLARMRGRGTREGSAYTPEKALPGDEALASYLSSINLSSKTKWDYEFKTFPRLTGKSTKVIITEYDLPRRGTQPHDAVVGPDGGIWYQDFEAPYLGRLDPNTGEVKEWKTPIPKPSMLPGGVEVAFDHEGNPFVGQRYQGSVIKFDRRTETFTVWSVPGDNEKSLIGHVAFTPAGLIWLKDQDNHAVHKLNPKTGKWVSFEAATVGTYGTVSDSRGNLWLANIQEGLVMKVDAETGKQSFYPTPTPNSGPRRVYMDVDDRFWFAEFRAHKIGMLDTKTDKFREWPIPRAWAGPYSVVMDKNGEIWSGGMYTDFIFRLNPNSGEVTEYPLPTLAANIRRIDVDKSANPAAVWVGENHQAKIAKIEPLE